ncbi:MAG: carboxyl transferase domain-containing protein [Bifidobacterium bifidum]
MIYAYANAQVPMVTVVLRKAFGGAYIVMGSKAIGADMNFAWPSSQIAVLGATGAVNIIHRKDFVKAKEAGEDVDALRVSSPPNTSAPPSTRTCRSKWARSTR